MKAKQNDRLRQNRYIGTYASSRTDITQHNFHRSGRRVLGALCGGYSMRVELISSKLAYPFLLNIHYAKRIPSISYAFGLYENDELIGVVTYGTPPSSPMRKGLLGVEYADIVIELNRLCLKYNRKNEASFLVGQSLRMLEKPKAIVSFADIAHDHLGIVYQATNFIYCGLSAKRTDWHVKGKEHLHGITIADEFRGVPNRAEAIRAKYGDDFSLVERSRKHRYVYFVGSKTEKKNMLSRLKYKIYEYPKMELAA